FLLVTLAWVLMAAIATLPLLLVIDDLSFTDAYFETMSGLTTTGATVLTGLDKLPPSINLWRHELNWVGGKGIIVLAVAILPLLGVGGMQLYKAETTGVMKDSKLTARIADTAKALWLVYFGITVACILALKLVGMNWLDAICHAFAAMGLGGFSTYDDSVGHFDSPAIEAVLIFFMMVAGMNFATHFVAWRGRSLQAYWTDMEAKAFVALIVVSTLVCTLYLTVRGTYPGFLTALRHVAFNLVSIATDCGFASQDFDKWPIFVPLWMLFLSCVSVSSGSTGGGIKMIRTLILAQQGLIELKRLVHPNLVAPLRVGDTAIPQQIAGAVLGFIFLYILAVGELTFFLVASGLDFTSSITAIVACINNAGPGLNVVGPAQNYGPLTDFQTWVCTFAMLLGRLEVLSVFVLFTPAFWRR
ncbi:MAG: TrkH family potassium uptake protein, partial [Betaproteobacteria bacterium]|nr:TrkH family potassium uptake protein [Betaproteobacteria bacterium]